MSKENPRRKFLKNSLLGAGSLAAGIPVIKAKPKSDRGSDNASKESLAVRNKEEFIRTPLSPVGKHDVVIETSAFRLLLNASEDGLMAKEWANKKSGDVISLNGHEIGFAVDTALCRIPIEGWRHVRSSTDPIATPETEEGLKKGYHSYDFDDSAWGTTISIPFMAWETEPGSEKNFFWARTHTFIPENYSSASLKLVLGGMGIWDYRYMRIFINGIEAGIRQWDGRWSEPMHLDIGLDSKIHSHLHFGQDNIIALQLTNQLKRTRRLDEYDPEGRHCFPYLFAKPPQFEQFIIVGQESEDMHLSVAKVEKKENSLKVLLQDKKAIFDVTVDYSWSNDMAVLSRKATIVNKSNATWRILNVRHAEYITNTSISDGEQGFPAYLGNHTFAALAHPAGWAIGKGNLLLLKQYPGLVLNTDETFTSMEVLLGAGDKNQAREAFLLFLRSRMCRVRRGQDHPYFILESFGSWERKKNSDWLSEDCSEEIILNYIKHAKEAIDDSSLHIDFFTNEFVIDPKGDLTRFKPALFPDGFRKVKEETYKLNVKPGLWVDSSMGIWNIYQNPAVEVCRTDNPSYRYDTFYCRATDPIRSMFKNAYHHHIKENGIKLLKFDNIQAICYNKSHNHLPGIYSTETIMNNLIDFYDDLNKLDQDVFIMLYWGYRSPMWLLHANTIFEPGIYMEAASPSVTPSLYARDGVTVNLDRAQAWANEIPPLGKDSLGVWLSDWPWNSSIGSERWQEGTIMDMCRGSMLMQPWSDATFLSTSERKQLAYFQKLINDNANCFANSTLFLGNPWKDEPYGYCCTNGKKSFLAINNCIWNDQTIRIKLSDKIGLTNKLNYRIYRHHPNPAQLLNKSGDLFKDEVDFSFSPYEVSLFEIIPETETGKAYYPSQKENIFSFPNLKTIKLDVRTEQIKPLENVKVLAETNIENLGSAYNYWQENSYDTKIAYRLTGIVSSVSQSRLLVVIAEIMKDNKPFRIGNATQGNIGRFLNLQMNVGGDNKSSKPILAEWCYPSYWQGWRVILDKNDGGNMEAVITAKLPKGCTIKFGTYII